MTILVKQYAINYHLSNGYIHLYCTSPPTSASYRRWIRRCSIESKKAGGNTLSNLQIIIRIFSSTLDSNSWFNDVKHKSLKKWLISIKGFKTLIGNELNTIGINVSVNTWQSWLFILWILSFSTSTLLAKFEE